MVSGFFLVLGVGVELIFWDGCRGKLNQKDPASIVIMTTQVTLTDDVRRVSVFRSFHVDLRVIGFFFGSP